MIKAVIFDIGGVIQPSAWDDFGELFSRSAEDILKVLRQDRENSLDLYETGDISTLEFVNQMLSRLDLEHTNKNITTATYAIGRFRKPDKDMLSLIKSLNSNVDRAILSNNWERMEEEILKLEGEDAYFQFFKPHIYLSHKIGLKKPDARAFEYVCSNLDVSPEQCIFIDDQVRNTTAAEKLGIKSHLYSNINDLRKQLEGFSLLRTQ